MYPGFASSVADGELEAVARASIGAAIAVREDG